VSLVELHRFYSQVDADLARLRLEAAGIRSVIFDASDYVGLIIGVRLMVLDEDKEDAERVLAEDGGAA
jgi:hypothetical protein